MTEIAMAKVKDLNAITEVRKHDLLDADGKIVPFEFKPHQYTAVPLTMATRFLVGNSGFEVLGPDGQVLRLMAQPQTGAGPGVVLRPDQVIAALDELTLDALVIRAVAKGGKFAKASGKKAVVEFLVGGAPAAAGAIDDLPEDEPLGVLAKD